MEITSTLSLNDPPSLTRFTETITNAALTSIPLKQSTVGRRSVPLWNKTVALAIKTRRKALKSLQRSRKTDNGALSV